jgi:hypothetical protein
MSVTELIDLLLEIRDKEQLVVDSEFNLINHVSETDDGYVVLY